MSPRPLRGGLTLLATVLLSCALSPAAAQAATTPPPPDAACGHVVVALDDVRRSEVSGKTVVSGSVIFLNRGPAERKAYAVYVDIDGPTLDYPRIENVKVFCGDGAAAAADGSVAIAGGGKQRKACFFSITAQGAQLQVVTARAYGLAPGNAKTPCVARAFIGQ